MRTQSRKEMWKYLLQNYKIYTKNRTTRGAILQNLYKKSHPGGAIVQNSYKKIAPRWVRFYKIHTKKSHPGGAILQNLYKFCPLQGYVLIVVDALPIVERGQHGVFYNFLI